MINMAVPNHPLFCAAYITQSYRYSVNYKPIKTPHRENLDGLFLKNGNIFV